MKVQDESSVIRGSEVAQLEGRMTRFQIIYHETLPVDHPLMVSLLADLPSRQCNNTSWREAGKMEYYYQGRLSMIKKESRLQQVTTRQEVKVHGAKAEELMAHLDPMVETMQTPRKALEDVVVKQDQVWQSKRRWKKITKTPCPM